MKYWDPYIVFLKICCLFYSIWHTCLSTCPYCFSWGKILSETQKSGYFNRVDSQTEFGMKYPELGCTRITLVVVFPIFTVGSFLFPHLCVYWAQCFRYYVAYSITPYDFPFISKNDWFLDTTFGKEGSEERSQDLEIGIHQLHRTNSHERSVYILGMY